MVEKPKFEFFGSYIILERIATGGMAAIYLARPADQAANGRLLVIKRILPQIANDPQFLKMFQSEIQVCMGFSHPNLVQLYDFGQVGGQHYIAMEYIEGKNLRQFIPSFVDRDQNPPIAISASIIAQSAAGLHYAHTFANRVTGEPLRVIHRDVSPQNILVTYDGNVKLIDFGVAKAELEDAEHTQSGTIKGKLCYLSPEQCKQEPLDGRSDIFSLGVVFWELLTGRKLFTSKKGEPYKTVELIMNSKTHVIPPSRLNSEVPAALDAIVMKALDHRADDRFQTMEEFQGAVRGYLHASHPTLAYRDVGQCLKLQFQQKYTEEKTHLQELNHLAQIILSNPGERSQMPPSPPRNTQADMPNGADGLPQGSSVSISPQPPPFNPQTALASQDVSGIRSISMSIPPSAIRRRLIGTRLLLEVICLLSACLLYADRQYMILARMMLPAEYVRAATIARSPLIRMSAMESPGDLARRSMPKGRRGKRSEPGSRHGRGGRTPAGLLPSG